MSGLDTLLRPATDPATYRRTSTSSLPADLLEQVRGRVRLLAMLLMIAFAFDPFFLLAGWVVATVAHVPLTVGVFAAPVFLAMNLGIVVASAILWWTARDRRLSSEVLHTVGLAYEVAVCFVIAFTTYWQYTIERGHLPNLTWVPTVVVLFPLILPGSPMRMLGASLVAGAMAPFALFVLGAMGRVHADLDAYFSSSIASAVAVFFAFMGARVVYGLGKQLAAAREMGSYQREEKLGAGGMGEVWRARHRLLARPAAIKLIRRSVDGESLSVVSEEARRRFEREAQATASLRSPHTVNLFDFGVTDDGAFYYVMELLDGLDAQRLVRQFGPLPAERAVHVLRQICHSLAEAEARGLVHRDIKPANIFLCRYGQDHDFVKVLDFGLVKRSDESPAENLTVLTRESAIHGTPAFIAPEQVMGGAIDHRVDLYATGCVAYWLLTGQLVFEGANPMAMFMQHVNTAPAAPSTRTELPIPPELDALVLACLEKDPARRPQTARELSARLAAVPCARAWNEGDAREWWEAHLPALA